MDDAPIPYIERTRVYYAALGFAAPYRWAEHADVPFQPLAKPLGTSRVALITTAAPRRPGLDQGPGAPYNGAAKFFAVYSGDTVREPALGINHVAIDFRNTTAEDIGSFFPLSALRRAKPRIGSVAPRFLGVPTNRSQRVTREVYAPEVLTHCRAQGTDAAILVPNCPVCHQSLALVARHLEANGIPTVVMGAAKDIVERAGVPRFLFSDFPLGNAAGRPNDIASQDLTLNLALDLLEQATAPRAYQQSPLRWTGDPDWKRAYGNVEGLSPEEIVRLRADFDTQKAAGKTIQAQG